MKIWFVRHGETAKNRDRLLQGRSDAPLNEAGIEQAGMARRFFMDKGVEFDRVISSPLRRAMQTARIITDGSNGNEKLEIQTDDRLLEMDYGPYEGTSLEHPSPEIIHFFSDFVHNPAPEGMESLAHVTGRMGDFLEDLKETDAESVLLATHAIALKGALEYLTPESDGQWWSRFISTCAVFSTEYDGKEYSLPVEEFQIR